jgi:hypothetical protein
VSTAKYDYADGILKRLQRRMQMKGVRMLQVARKKKGSSVLLYRAYTWEEACRLIEIERDNIQCQIEKINQT